MTTAHYSLVDAPIERFDRNDQLALIRQGQAGDTDARNRLVASYTPAVVGIVARRCRRDFDDCTQFAFMRLMRAAELFDPARGIAVSTYFITTIHRAVSRFNRDNADNSRQWRDRALEHEFDGDRVIGREDIDAEVDARESVVRVTELLKCLTEREKSIVMRYYAGSTLKVIGEEMGVTRERIRQIKLDALTRIRRRLGVAVEASN